LSTFSSVKKIIVTGPESSGKTTLAKELSKYYRAKYYPEFARTYAENLNRKCAYEDVVLIAKHQIKELSDSKAKNTNEFIFYDTGLVITKIWFEYAFGKVPDFLIKSLKEIKIDAYLLCYPDLEWKPDKVRENGGIIRFELFERYKQEIEKYKTDYFIIRNKGEQRFLSAKEYLSSAYCL
jgi:NadR type nicotinamide-nucleotide adenylyltransferase